MRAFRRLIDAIEAEGSAALVTLTRVEGSSPREAGVRMVVRPSGGFHGTVGGGALEFAALDAAQAALRAGRGPAFRRLIGAIEAEGSATLVTLTRLKVQGRTRRARAWWLGLLPAPMARSAAARLNWRRSTPRKRP